MNKALTKDFVLLHGDCLEHLKFMGENSVDALVTDPPGGISFMGKEWDKSEGFIPTMTEIFKECLRVMKPGAHGLVWAIPRTSHWTATALEDAGFEIRDVVTHLFGSGFPKSYNIAQSIEKTHTLGRARRADRNLNKGRVEGSPTGHGYENLDTGGQVELTTPEAKKWQGFGTALKPASEHWILIRKPLSEKTVAANVLRWGCGGLNIDASRISGTKRDPGFISGRPGSMFQEGNDGVCDKQGRFPSNLLFSHNPDCVEVGVKKVKSTGGLAAHKEDAKIYGKYENQDRFNYASPDGTETVSAFECTPGCAVAMLDMQGWPSWSNGVGPSRFFYCAKSSKRDKNAGLEGMPKVKGGSMSGEETRPDRPTNHPYNENFHPTVKSTTLMAYLIKLVTAPGGLVLDPFLGSGSTGVAALREGFRFIGIEKEKEYIDIAQKRMEAK